MTHAAGEAVRSRPNQKNLMPSSPSLQFDSLSLSSAATAAYRIGLLRWRRREEEEEGGRDLVNEDAGGEKVGCWRKVPNPRQRLLQEGRGEKKKRPTLSRHDMLGQSGSQDALEWVGNPWTAERDGGGGRNLATGCKVLLGLLRF